MTSDQGPITDLDDIRTVKDNTALAQQLFGFIKQLAADPQTALHCSIAGGRKTMSAYMALALTLYGRQQDRLSHVLVTEQFESAPDFFFPPQRPVSIGAMQAGRPIVVNTKDARIELAEIPFVRLRQALGERFTALDQTVEETIQTVQQELNLTQTSPERLIIDLRERQVRFGATPISLSPMMLALYAYFAQTKTDHCLRLDLPACGQCTDCYQGFNQLDKDRFVNIYRRVYPRSPGQFNEWLAKKNKKGPVMDTDNYQSYISAANRQIESAQVSQQLKITSVGAYGGKRYGLGIDKNRIEIVDRTSV